MAADAFHIALTGLRDRLRDGVYPPGARIMAVDLADELRLSATPVREALSRLAGEGLVEDRRGQGFFIRRLSPGDIADLYRLSLAYLLIAHEPARKAASGQSSASEATEDAVVLVERLFLQWASEGGGRLLVSRFRLVQLQLGPVRRLEPLLIDDLAAEAGALLALQTVPRAERLPAVRRFHARRIRLADRLSSLREAAEARSGL